ncbi:hypothetical protein [Flagellimonas halotolerans]|uniref:Uncharacterized protein n=1 Tax=Flagellimonas halotolerans TaxID=3112164 RepID=A0ABU6IUC0_9FLAO|nr:MULTISPECIES: hypothetical protein [unclassified Allomuricauda]MEC3966853.1 hypothetical protein [Muricauda sp. SYSU M86414]MEC4266741.1 hypothetical protein [Muricauda sp. SYSU M84420]
MEKFRKHIKACFKRVEEKLGKGPCNKWDTHDFKTLSENIQEETGTLLSVSTLKRLSGKVNYASHPNKTTLNALANYIGFKDWGAFSNYCDGKFVKGKKEGKANLPMKPLIAFLLLGIALFSSVFLTARKNDTIYNPDDFAFNGKSVTMGLPNSVVFRYDASAADEKAKIEIQQDWDESKRVLVNKNDSVSTSIYYRPGYFKSKLVVDETIVKEKGILIPTSDWVGVIETDSIPIYLDRKDYRSKKALSIKASSLKKYGVDPRASRTPVGFYQIRDFGELYTTNFEMTASIRNDFKSGKSQCQTAQLVIVHEDGPISIMLADKGCISDIMLYAFNKTIDGKKTDLSGFGVDFTDFVEVKCISKDGKLDIVMDKQPIFSFEVPDIPKKIVGLSIHFEGAGTVQHVSFKNNGEILYSTNF